MLCTQIDIIFEDQTDSVNSKESIISKLHRITYDEENHVCISSASILIHSYPKACQYFLPVLMLVAEKHWTTGVYFTLHTTRLYRSCILTSIQLYYMFQLSVSLIIRYKYWFTKRVKRERLVLTYSGYKVMVKFVIIMLNVEK